MKYLILLLTILLSSCSTINHRASEPAQVPSNLSASTQQQLLNFDQTLSTDLSKAEAYQLSIAWAHTFLLDPAKAITYSNASTATIIGKYKNTNSLQYINTFKIQCFADSVTISISNPTTKEGSTPINKKLSPERAALIISDWKQTSSSLFTYINTAHQ
jgi:hypothetical protein